LSERKKVGLALASGGGRGMAHIGVLQVLTEHGIPIDLISGCSAGALVAAIYAADTPTNVLPSMHVVGCLGVMAAVFDGEDFAHRGRWFFVLWGVAICASTVFVKQHSILDVIAGIAFSVILYLLIYVVLRKPLDRIGTKIKTRDR
jgi:membrane-associated phospholipid phosphatase